MNRTERILSTFLILIFGYLGVQWLVKNKVIAPLKAKDVELADLAASLERKQQDLLEAQKADLDIKTWNKQSLPYDPSLATTAYQNHLKALFKLVGMSEAEIKPSRPIQVSLPRSTLPAFRKLSFQVDVKTDLEKLTKFLHLFDKEQHLSQVRSLRVKPNVEKDGHIKDFQVELHIEAVSMPQAVAKGSLPEFKAKPANSTDQRPVDEFAIIAKKNLFQPTKIVKIDAPVVVSREAPTVSDDTKEIYLNHISTLDSVGKIWLKNNKDGTLLKFSQGEEIKVNGFQGKLIAVHDNLRAIIQVGQNVGTLRLGQSLSNWKPDPPELGNASL